MNRRLLKALLTLSLLFAAMAPGIADEGKADPNTTTLTGMFDWNGHTQGDLEAVFTPAGEGRWKVAFHFVFRGKPHVYKGLAEGNLDGGELNGEVRNENGKRRFTFRGAFEEGKFSGSHAEVHGERTSSTGILSLSR